MNCSSRLPRRRLPGPSRPDIAADQPRHTPRATMDNALNSWRCGTASPPRGRSTRCHQPRPANLVPLEPERRRLPSRPGSWVICIAVRSRTSSEVVEDGNRTGEGRVGVSCRAEQFVGERDRSWPGKCSGRRRAVSAWSCHRPRAKPVDVAARSGPPRSRCDSVKFVVPSSRRFPPSQCSQITRWWQIGTLRPRHAD